MLTGKTAALEIKPSDTIESIMAKIQDKEGVPCEQQHLIVDRQKIMNGHTFSNYIIQEKSFLHLILHLHGMRAHQ